MGEGYRASACLLSQQGPADRAHYKAQGSIVFIHPTFDFQIPEAANLETEQCLPMKLEDDFCTGAHIRPRLCPFGLSVPAPIIGSNLLPRQAH